MKNFKRWCGKVITSAFSYITIALSLASLFLGLWVHHAFGVSSWASLTIALCLLLLIQAVHVYVKKLYDTHRDYPIYEGIIKQLFAASAVSVLRVSNPPLKHLRVNIMFPDHKEQYLQIQYHHGFEQDKDFDVDIKIWRGTGCSGQAWLKKKAMLADSSEVTGGVGGNTPPAWGLEEQEIKKLRPSLKSIFSIPIFSDDQKPKVIAVLNFDSDNTASEVLFDDEGVQGIMYSFAAAFKVILKEMNK